MPLPAPSPPTHPIPQGYLAPAMVNYLSLLGWNDGTEKEIYSVDELQGAFALERITKARLGDIRGRSVLDGALCVCGGRAAPPR